MPQRYSPGGGNPYQQYTAPQTTLMPTYGSNSSGWQNIGSSGSGGNAGVNVPGIGQVSAPDFRGNLALNLGVQQGNQQNTIANDLDAIANRMYTQTPNTFAEGTDFSRLSTDGLIQSNVPTGNLTGNNIDTSQLSASTVPTDNLILNKIPTDNLLLQNASTDNLTLNNIPTDNLLLQNASTDDLILNNIPTDNLLLQNASTDDLIKSNVSTDHLTYNPIEDIYTGQANNMSTQAGLLSDQLTAMLGNYGNDINTPTFETNYANVPGLDSILARIQKGVGRAQSAAGMNMSGNHWNAIAENLSPVMFNALGDYNKMNIDATLRTNDQRLAGRTTDMNAILSGMNTMYNQASDLNQLGYSTNVANQSSRNDVNAQINQANIANAGFDQDYNKRLMEAEIANAGFAQDYNTRTNEINIANAGFEQDYNKRLMEAGIANAGFAQDYNTRLNEINIANAGYEQEYNKRLLEAGIANAGFAQDYNARLNEINVANAGFEQDYNKRLLEAGVANAGFEQDYQSNLNQANIANAGYARDYTNMANQANIANAGFQQDYNQRTNEINLANANRQNNLNEIINRPQQNIPFSEIASLMSQAAGLRGTTLDPIANAMGYALGSPGGAVPGESSQQTQNRTNPWNVGTVASTGASAFSAGGAPIPGAFANMNYNPNPYITYG